MGNKIPKTSGPCQPIIKDLAFLSSLLWMERKESNAEKMLEEITAENFANMTRDMNLQTQEIITPNMRNLRKSTPRHIIIKMKTKNRKYLEISQRKMMLYL